MELELKHLASYLPYGLKVSPIHTLHGHTGIGSIEHIVQAVNEGKKQYKPILRPLSDLTKEIEHNGEKFVLIKKLGINKMWLGLNDYHLHVHNQPYSEVQQLLEWHFDIFGLIEKGLAVDINTLNK